VKFKTDFHSKMRVCIRELGVEPPIPSAIPTMECFKAKVKK